MLKRFQMEYSSPVSTPMVVGCKFSKYDITLDVDHVGMFYRKRVLVIDGKNNNDDGKQEKHKLRRRSEQYAEIKAQKEKQYRNVIRINISTGQTKTIENSITRISISHRIKLSEG
jgi:hypothetical protein